MSIATVKWNGQEAAITEAMAFEIADAVEQHMTVGELAVMRTYPGRIRYAKLSRAYAALLTEAGIPVSARDVHKELTKALRSNSREQDRLKYTLEILDWLLTVLMDGAPEPEQKDKEDAASGK